MLFYTNGNNIIFFICKKSVMVTYMNSVFAFTVTLMKTFRLIHYRNSIISYIIILLLSRSNC